MGDVMAQWEMSWLNRRCGCPMRDMVAQLKTWVLNGRCVQIGRLSNPFFRHVSAFTEYQKNLGSSIATAHVEQQWSRLVHNQGYTLLQKRLFGVLL
jgi:hypothetical protein